MADLLGLSKPVGRDNKELSLAECWGLLAPLDGSWPGHSVAGEPVIFGQEKRAQGWMLCQKPLSHLLVTHTLW